MTNFPGLCPFPIEFIYETGAKELYYLFDILGFFLLISLAASVSLVIQIGGEGGIQSEREIRC